MRLLKINIKTFITFSIFITNVPMKIEGFEKNSHWRWQVLNKYKPL